MIDVRVQGGDFDSGRQLERLAELSAGAVASLIVQAAASADAEAVLVEHYAAMAKPELTRIADEAMARWPLNGIILIHRHGRLARGERLLFAGVGARDRAGALAACTFLAEQASRRAPFWRREMLAEGGGRWVRGVS